MVEPRLASSKKWTPIPADYTKQVVEALNESFASEIRSGKFVVEGRIYSGELLLSMGYLQKGQLRQSNFEISVDYKGRKDDTIKLLNLAVDVGATMLEELFSSESNANFPRTWEEFEVEGRKVYLQFSAANSDLEKQADKILGAVGGDLVEDDPESSTDEIKAGLGIDPDEDGDPTIH